MQEQGFGTRGFSGGEQAPGNPRPRQPFQASQAQVRMHLNDERTDFACVLSFDSQILIKGTKLLCGCVQISTYYDSQMTTDSPAEGPGGYKVLVLQCSTVSLSSTTILIRYYDCKIT
jgi:hypothetical protein